MAGAITFFKKNVKDKSQYKAKIMSTLAAVFIWFLVVIGGTYEHVTNIPIKSPLENEDYIITSNLPDKVRVRIQGQGKDLLTFLLFKDAWLQLNLDWKSGIQIIQPNTSDIILARSAKRLNIRQLISPDSVKIVIENKITQKVPVQSQITINPVRGYTIVGQPEISPSHVQVQGANSKVKQLNSVQTENTTFNEVKYPIKTEISLISPDPGYMKLQQNKITFNADIQKLMEKKLYTIPVNVRKIPPHTRAIVMPSHLSLTVQGGVNEVFPLESDDINAYINYTEKDTTFIDYPVNIEPIENIRFRDIDPERFKVVLERTNEPFTE